MAIVFTALLGLTRAFVAEREQRLIDGLLLAPCDRSAIWLAKTISVLAFLGIAELVALPAFALFFSGIGWSTLVAVLLADVGIVAVGTLLAAIAAVEPRPRAAPSAPLPAARDPGRGRRRGRERGGDPGRYLGFLCLYDAVFAIISWASFEYVVTE